MSNTFSRILKHFFPFIGWLLGLYIALFVMCFYAHVNESNIIANKADELLIKIAHEGKSALRKIASVQNMTRKTKPSILEPYTIYNSLFGKREPFKIINKLLGNVIENHKAKLAGLDLAQVDLEVADLSEADMHGADLREANLSGAVLRGANLIAAKLGLVDFRGARFLKAILYKADLSDAILNGADLKHTVGVTCDQIKSAVVDESTRLPDYISMVGSTKSVFKCVNFQKGAGLDIRGVNLENIYLHSADLKKSNLSHVNFQNATLVYSFFYDADLSEANLQGANMTHSHFNETNFTGTDLRGANLNSALGLTCSQIKSAVIDENTRLPDYISLTGSSDAAYKCENALNKN